MVAGWQRSWLLGQAEEAVGCSGPGSWAGRGPGCWGLMSGRLLAGGCRLEEAAAVCWHLLEILVLVLVLVTISWGERQGAAVSSAPG